MQRSAPTFNPYNVQCILISQIMLFSVDQHHYIVPCCNVEACTYIYKHARCQLVKCMNWPDSLDYKNLWKLALPGRYFLMHIMWLMISQTFFLQDSDNISYHTWKIFFPSSYLLLLLWSFYILAIYVCLVLISDGMAHSDLVNKNISIYPEKVFFSYEAEL